MERAMRIELTTKAWEAFVLPLNYARKPLCYMIVARLFEKSRQKSYWKTLQSLFDYENRIVFEELKAFAFSKFFTCRDEWYRYGVLFTEFVVH